MTRAPRKKPVAVRLNPELRGGTLADDRSELLADQARARATEHFRRQAERAAKPSTTCVRAQVSPPERIPIDGDSTPRPLTRVGRLVATDRAPVRWLAEPVALSANHRTRVVGFATPPGPPLWLAEILDTKEGKDADSTI